MKIFFLKAVFASAAVFLIYAFSSVETVSIKISSPTVKSTYKVRDTVWIEAQVTSTEALHNVNIRVISLKDSTIMYTKQIHSHGTSMTIREFYINLAFQNQDMKLSISTTGHEGLESAKGEVVFKCLARKKKE